MSTGRWAHCCVVAEDCQTLVDHVQVTAADVRCLNVEWPSSTLAVCTSSSNTPQILALSNNDENCLGTNMNYFIKWTVVELSQWLSLYIPSSSSSSSSSSNMSSLKTGPDRPREARPDTPKMRPASAGPGRILGSPVYNWKDGTVGQGIPMSVIRYTACRHRTKPKNRPGRVSGNPSIATQLTQFRVCM